ncbi:hypothetical protein P4O66_003337 [Electrophorus voltai]|uniref:DNA-directed DNA polymerase n=1 Tax=Electrophorus voltai TaxID=2609070 RepID=A0AAD9DLC7_9TELE|nr:hypothetical protein P4O66_003337 [Electrophorus voltai]
MPRVGPSTRINPPFDSPVPKEAATGGLAETPRTPLLPETVVSTPVTVPPVTLAPVLPNLVPGFVYVPIHTSMPVCASVLDATRQAYHDPGSCAGFGPMRTPYLVKNPTQSLTPGPNPTPVSASRFVSASMSPVGPSFVPYHFSFWFFFSLSAMGFTDAKKGTFPHFYNTVENQNYAGSYPQPEFYGVDTMKPKERQDFFDWREILRDTGIDPFKSITIASLCMKIFRTMFLPENTLAIPPLDNYINCQKSFLTPSIQWLEYVSDRQNIPIQHALNNREAKIRNYFVDGYFDDGKMRKAFKFLGCFYHGCDTCFPSCMPHPLSKASETFRDVYQNSLNIIQMLQCFHKLSVTIMWEHEWNDMQKNDEDVKKFLKTFDFPECLNLWDALFGGRTNALQLYYTAQPGERIDYYDFTSLYPYVIKVKMYPIGHPVILYCDLGPLENYFGIIKIKVLRPRVL